jgi:MFS family permease
MPQTGKEDRRRSLALYVLCVGILMIVLDATIVNVALPTIQKDLGFSQNDLAWVVNAYRRELRDRPVAGDELIGLGYGLGFPSLMTLAMSGATPSDSGLALGLVNTSVQVGGAIGLAVLATFATERTAGRLADGEPPATALNAGCHLVYLIGAWAGGGRIVIAVTVLRSRVPENATEPGAEAPGEPVERPRIEPSPCPPMRCRAAAASRPGCAS